MPDTAALLAFLAASAASRFRPWSSMRQEFARWRQRIMGGVLIGLGVRLAVARR